MTDVPPPGRTPADAEPLEYASDPAPRPPVLHKPWTWPLHWQILLGLLVGAGLGFISALTALSAAEAAGNPTGAEALVLDRWDFLLYDLIGDMFLNGLKLIIVPIVLTSIVLAVSQISSGATFGRLGLKTLTYYLTTSTIAILIGLTLVDLLGPGYTADGRGILEGEDLSAFQGDVEQVTGRAAGREASDFLDVFRQMVPPNIFDAASDNGQLLGLIVVALLIGYFLARLHGESARVITAFVEGAYEITLKVVGLVLALAPIGVAMLIAATVAQYYARLAPDDRFAEFVGGIVTFAITVVLALGIHFLVIMPLILIFIARVNPLRHYKAMAPALVTAFSTSSSGATLPVTMKCVEHRAGVSNKTTSFVLPLGATVNMDGTALYECVAAVFIAQAFGVELSFAQQFFVVVAALLTSIGVASVPSASIVAIVLILTAVGNQVGLPLVAGLGLIWVFDRPLDMMRTVVNIFSDSVGAVTIARSEGETQVLADPAPSVSG